MDSLPVHLPNKKLRTDILTLEVVLMQAFADGDQTVLASLIDEECVGFGVFGDLYSRTRLVSDRRCFALSASTLLSLETKLYGEVAVTLSEWNVNLETEGAFIHGPVRISRVWNLRGNCWKLVAFHVSDARLGKKWSAVTKHSG